MNRLHCVRLEDRIQPALPVLMVIADQRDFYYTEYADTRASLLAANVPVVVAATTTAPSKAHANSGQGSGSGIVTPNIALANVDPDNYSAIAFVGGWGASMYQYAFNDPNADGKIDNFYSDSHYNGDTNLGDGIIAPQKIVVNNLIREFLADDKPVAAVCNAVTVLAWARVSGVSPLAGKNVVMSHNQASPAMFFNGTSYPIAYNQGQYIQVIANGGIASPNSGTIGNPTTTADDVVVDGRIITGENQFSAAYFGTVIAQQVNVNQPPTPITGPATIAIPEGVPGTIASYSSTDPEGGPIAWSLAGSNATKFSISSTGALTSTVEFDGPYSLTVQVVATDAAGKTNEKWIEIQGWDVAPSVVSLTGPTTLIVGEAGTFQLTGVNDIAIDLASIKSSFYEAIDPPAVSFANATGGTAETISFSTPGAHTISGRAYDKDGGISETKTFTVNVVAPPTVLGMQINDGTAQRSRVTSQTVTFSAQVSATTLSQPGAIQFVRDGGPTVSNSKELQYYTVELTNSTSTPGVRITIDPQAVHPGLDRGSLADGRWQIRIPLLNYTSPEFHRLFGDIDGNGAVDGPTDFAAFGNDFGRTLRDSPFDVNGDGVIDGPTDFAAFGANFGKTI